MAARRFVALAVALLLIGGGAAGCSQRETPRRPLKAYAVAGLPEFVCAFDVADLHRLSPKYKQARRVPQHDAECNQA